MEKFAEMGKMELRAACKDAGIKNYSKMTVAQMRDELVAYHTANTPADDFEMSQDELDAQVGRAKSDEVEGEQPAEETPAEQPAAPAPKQVDRHSGNGLKIEKNREERNGVKRPSAGGKCREIWDYLDEVYEGGKGVMPTAKLVKEAAEQCDWNPNNASIEFYQWRKFNGITGRSK